MRGNDASKNMGVRFVVSLFSYIEDMITLSFYAIVLFKTKVVWCSFLQLNSFRFKHILLGYTCDYDWFAKQISLARDHRGQIGKYKWRHFSRFWDLDGMGWENALLFLKVFFVNASLVLSAQPIICLFCLSSLCKVNYSFLNSNVSFFVPEIFLIPDKGFLLSKAYLLDTCFEIVILSAFTLLVLSHRARFGWLLIKTSQISLKRFQYDAFNAF